MLFLTSLVQAAQIVVLTYNPVVIWVDGRVVESPEVGNEVVAGGLPPGRHLVEARTALGKPLAATTISLATQATDTRLFYQNGSFAPYDSAHPPTPSGSELSVSVVAPGAGGLVVVSGPGLSMSAAAGAPVPPPAPTPPPPPSPSSTAPVHVELLSADGEWSNVYIDGTKVAEFRNNTRVSITLTPGVHTLEVRDFMENAVWYKGQVKVSGAVDPLKIGILKESKPEVYNDPGALK